MPDQNQNALPLQGRIALITGATRGIGRAVAIAYAKAGAHVIATGRKQDDLEALDDEIAAIEGAEPATLVALELTDFDAIDRLGAAVAGRWGKLDILVGNAAILGQTSPIGHIAVDVWQELMDVNVTANWRLIRAMDALIRASDAGRAIFVTSGAAHSAKQYWGGYATSKAALEMIARTWAAEMRDTPHKVNLINPGPMRTDMRAQAMPGEDPMSLPAPEEITPLFVQLASPNCEETGEIFDFKK